MNKLLALLDQPLLASPMVEEPIIYGISEASLESYQKTIKEVDDDGDVEEVVVVPVQALEEYMDGGCTIELGPDGNRSALTLSLNDKADITPAQFQTIARHLVAAWNFCTDFSTEYLEGKEEVTA